MRGYRVSRRTRAIVAFATGLGIASIGVEAQEDRFSDQTEAAGVVHHFMAGFDRMGNSAQLYDWAQSGVALGDIDNDGDTDVIACGGLLSNTALRNDGGVFTDVTELTGIESSEFDRMPALGDYDRDGDLDLWIGALDRGIGRQAGYGRLYRNDGSGRFEDVTAVSGTTGAGHSLHARWADLNLDGWLDLYVSEFHSTRNLYYRNNGDGTFTEMSEELGLDSTGSAHVTAIFDADRDGYFDIFVGNDWVATEGAAMPNNAGDFELHCQTDFSFLDVTSGSGNDIERAIMGMAVGDVNYDGWMDLYKTDGGSNYLMVNNGWPDSGLAWTEEQDAYGVAADEVRNSLEPTEIGPAIGWGAAFFDADQDRWLDLFVANGFVAGPGLFQNPHTRFEENFFFIGVGPDGDFRFDDQTPQSGLVGRYDDRGVAIGDMDADGDLDVFVNPTFGHLRYYENRLEGLPVSDRGYVKVKPVCNTSAPGCQGARISRIDVEGYPHVRLIGADAPTASQHDESVAHFGLGDEVVTDVTVEFPSGLTLDFEDVPVNTTVEAVEPLIVSLPERKVERRGLFSSDTFVVKVFAYDRQGNKLDRDANVNIEVPGALEWSSVRFIADNEFEQEFLVPREAGFFRVSVNIDGWNVHVEPSLLVYNDPSLSGSRFLVSPEAVRAGSDDTFTVTVVAGDSNGFLARPGLDISARVAGQSPLNGTVATPDGRYIMEFDAPKTAALHDVDIVYNGNVVGSGGQAQIEVAGPADSGNSRFYVEEGQELNSAAPHMLKLLVAPRDAQDLRLGPGADVTIGLVPGDGSAAVQIYETPFPPQVDGDFPFVIEKVDPDDELAAVGTIEVFVDGVKVGDVPFDY